MKKKWPLLLCVVIPTCGVLLLCVGGIFFFKNGLQPKGAVFENSATNEVEYTPGYIKGKVYINKSLNLKYTPSDKMTVARSEEINDDNREITEENSTHRWEFFGIIPVEDKKARGIFIYSYEVGDSIADVIESDIKNIKTDKTAYDRCKIGNVVFTKVLNLKDGQCLLYGRKGSFIIEINVRIMDGRSEAVDELLSGFSEIKQEDEAEFGSEASGESTNAETTQEVGDYVPGVIQPETYKSDWLKIKYTANNSNMSFYSRDQLKKMTDKLNARIDKSEHAYVDFMMDGKDESITIFVRTFSDSKGEAALASKLAVTYDMDKMISAPYKIGDVEFTKVSNLKDNSKWNTLLVKRMGKYYVEILLSASSNEKVEKLLSGFSKL